MSYLTKASRWTRRSNAGPRIKNHTFRPAVRYTRPDTRPHLTPHSLSHHFSLSKFPHRARVSRMESSKGEENGGMQRALRRPPQQQVHYHHLLFSQPPHHTSQPTLPLLSSSHSHAMPCPLPRRRDEARVWNAGAIVSHRNTFLPHHLALGGSESVTTSIHARFCCHQTRYTDAAEGDFCLTQRRRDKM